MGNNEMHWRMIAGATLVAIRAGGRIARRAERDRPRA
jgi:hypothetical protein